MSLNFDSYGRLPDDPDYDGSQLGSMELYNLKIQKLKDVFTDYDAVTKKYVDSKIDDLLNGAGSAYDTLKEIETAINGADQNVVGGMLKEIADLSADVATEKARAEGIEGGLASRIATLEADPSTGASVTAVQNEVNAVETGAGLNIDGTYTANASSNYISLAESLKDADNKLDAQLKAEVDRASGAESTIASNLSTHIAAFETEKKSNDEDKFNIGQRITDLNTSDIAEGEKLFYTEQRVKNASVHNYSPFNPSERTYDPPVEASVGYAFELLNAELQDIHSKEDADDTRHTDLNVSLSTVAGTVTTERGRAISAEEALSSRVDVFEEGLNNGMEVGDVYYQENLGVQAVVDDLRGGINFVNGAREADKATADTRHEVSEGRHDTSESRLTTSESRLTTSESRLTTNESDITGLSNNKFDKEGGIITGQTAFNADTGFNADVGMTGNIALNVQHANQDQTMNGTGKYLYFSERWRMYGKSDGSRLIFEYNSGTQESANWKAAVPFISSM